MDRFLVPVDDPGSRLFHLNLFFSVLIFLFWIWFERYRIRSLARLGRRLLLRKSYWWNPSTKVDYQVYFLNSLFKIFLFLPFLDFSFRASLATLKLCAVAFGPFRVGSKPEMGALFLFSVFAFVLDDGLRFGQHILMHKVPWLWKVHQAHHSASTLTPITLYRIHPIESALSMLRNSLSLGLSAGIFMYFFDAEFSVVTLLGVNFFGFVFNLLGANLRHSHIPISFGAFERIFISPKQHQIHHSLEPHHFDKNFGVSLSLWDQISGSYLKSRGAENLRFGVRGVEPNSLQRLLAQPFH